MTKKEVSLLSGMTPKTQDRHQEAIDKWLSEGNKITQIPSKFSKKHTSRTKSHMKGGGRWGAYNVGGNNRIAATRRSA